MKKRILTRIFVCAVSAAAVPTAWALNYVVQSGDSLSIVAHRYLHGKVYGRHGSLAQLIQQNPQFAANPDKIYVGQTVTVPAKAQSDLTPVAQNTVAPSVAEAPATHITTAIDAVPPPSARSALPDESTNRNPVALPDHDEVELRVGVGYGGSLINFKQTGAFGGIEGQPIALNLLSVRGEARFDDDFRAAAEFSHYSINFSTDTSDPSKKESKDFQDFSLIGGYKLLNFGIHGSTIPVLQTSGATALLWGDLSTLWVVAGIHLEKEGQGRRSFYPYRLQLDANTEYPLSGGGNAGFTLNDLSGLGVRIRGRVQKALLNSDRDSGIASQSQYQLFLGLEGVAAYHHLSYQGSWNGIAGNVSQDLQEYQALVTLEFSL